MFLEANARNKNFNLHFPLHCRGLGQLEKFHVFFSTGCIIFLILEKILDHGCISKLSLCA